MAKIKGQLVKTEISSDGGTTWKELICEQSSGAEMTRETQTAPFTKCDTATAAQEITPLGYNWNFPFEALVDDAAAATQMTYPDLLTLFVNGTSVTVRRQYDNTGSIFYVSGTAYLTRLSESSPADGFVSCTGTFSGSGALDITA